MLRLLFAAFLIVPLIEIYLLLQVAGLVGIMPTVLMVVATAFMGAILIRVQGIATLLRFQQRLRQRELPALELFTGVALLMAGAFLLTPGFFTDTLGFLLLVPHIRAGLFAYCFKNPVAVFGSALNKARNPKQRNNQTVIDTDWERLD